MSTSVCDCFKPLSNLSPTAAQKNVGEKNKGKGSQEFSDGSIAKVRPLLFHTTVDVADTGCCPSCCLAMQLSSQQQLIPLFTSSNYSKFSFHYRLVYIPKSCLNRDTNKYRDNNIRQRTSIRVKASASTRTIPQTALTQLSRSTDTALSPITQH